MIDHTAIHLALRNHALTLEVAMTGSVTLTATASGYTRGTGSFITDGFRVGQELVGVGFSNDDNNAAKTITSVTALAILADGTVAETAAVRALTVGLPASQQWENIPLAPETGRPYVAEQYIPGPMRQETLGKFGELEALPIYVLHFYGLQNVGLAGVTDYADATLTLFAPGTAITVGSDTLRVRRDTAPFRGQILHVEPGWAMLPVNIPCRLRTANAI
jgi:hypothetical protein